MQVTEKQKNCHHSFLEITDGVNPPHTLCSKCDFKIPQRLVKVFKPGEKVIRIVEDSTFKRMMLCEVALVTILGNHEYFSKVYPNHSIIDYGNGVAQVNNKTLFRQKEAFEYLKKFFGNAAS